MVNARYARGASFERDLCAAAWQHGYACIRGAASGGARRRWSQPDVVIIHDGVCWAIECKATRSDSYRVVISRLGKLLEWSRRSSCAPIVAVRFAGRGYDAARVDAYADTVEVFALKPRFRTIQQLLQHIIIL